MNLNLALTLLTSILTEGVNLSNAIGKARADGREDLTDEEVASFAGADDAAKARLQSKIDALPTG